MSVSEDILASSTDDLSHKYTSFDWSHGAQDNPIQLLSHLTCTSHWRGFRGTVSATQWLYLLIPFNGKWIFRKAEGYAVLVLLTDTLFLNEVWSKGLFNFFLLSTNNYRQSLRCGHTMKEALSLVTDCFWGSNWGVREGLYKYCREGN